MSVSEPLSVDSGQVMDVTLSCPADQLAVGDKTITCFGGNQFFSSKTPACLPQGILDNLSQNAKRAAARKRHRATSIVFCAIVFSGL